MTIRQAKVTEEAGTPYTGPGDGLQWQFIDLSPDNLDIAAITPNSFIFSGLGNDAINVSQAGGNNILDASGGSNFLVGGSGNDTFFLNHLNPTAPIWSTLVNFHAGDAATIWGVTPANFSIAWVAGEGAPAYSGLTMHVTAAGKPAEYLTLAGMIPADLSNGHLAVQFGTVNGTNYMEINHL
jgi:Ca2+-binding RTX toxin-like protein